MKATQELIDKVVKAIVFGEIHAESPLLTTTLVTTGEETFVEECNKIMNELLSSTDAYDLEEKARYTLIAKAAIQALGHEVDDLPQPLKLLLV